MWLRTASSPREYAAPRFRTTHPDPASPKYALGGCPRSPEGRYVVWWACDCVARSECATQTRLRILSQESASVRIEAHGNRPNPKITLQGPKCKSLPWICTFAAKLASCRTRWRAGIVEADRIGPWVQSAFMVAPGACFTPLHVLTILSETVKRSSEFSPRRDRRAVVRRDSCSGKLSGGLGAT